MEAIRVVTEADRQAREEAGDESGSGVGAAAGDRPPKSLFRRHTSPDRLHRNGLMSLAPHKIPLVCAFQLQLSIRPCPVSPPSLAPPALLACLAFPPRCLSLPHSRQTGMRRSARARAHDGGDDAGGGDDAAEDHVDNVDGDESVGIAGVGVLGGAVVVVVVGCHRQFACKTGSGYLQHTMGFTMGLYMVQWHRSPK